MALQLTPESFLAVVKQSGLVDPDRLQKLLNEFRLRGIKLEQARTIADELVASNAVTRWQAEKLLQGKHRGFFLGKYRLLSLLGKGGMSSVYLAEHTVMRRRCAIKVLPTKRVNDTSYLGRFHREAQAVANLDHPNIVRAYDVDKEMEGDTEIHFLVMEYVDGESLQEMVASSGQVDYATAAEFARQAAEGLVHAHAAGMVHRDIKPGNLLVDPNGMVKILDMGLARFFDDEDQESLTVTHDEKVLGTADYLAPEQALDSHTVDARADIYSLGCTLYFMLTGHPPFTEGTLAQRLMSHQVKEPPPIWADRPDAPADLIALIAKMMSKDVSRRCQSAAEVSEALYRWLLQHAGEDWRLKHATAPGSGPSLGSGGPDSGSQFPSRGGLRGASTQPAFGTGLQTAFGAPATSSEYTANLSGSETDKATPGSRGRPVGGWPVLGGPVDDIPLAPLDEDEGDREALLPAEGKPEPRKSTPPRKAPTPPVAERGSPASRQPVSPTRGSAASPPVPRQGGKSGTALTKPPAPAGGKSAPSGPSASRTSPGPKSGVLAGQQPQRPQPPQAPRQPAKSIIARPLGPEPDDQDTVAEAMPIESSTPLAELVTPPPRFPTDSRMLRTMESAVLRARQRSRDKMVFAGAGLILLVLVVVVVLVIISSNDGGTDAVNGESGKVPSSPSSADRTHHVVNVGPQGDFQTVTEALNHVRQTFVPQGRDTQTILVAGGHTYRESLVLDDTAGAKWPTGIRLVCEDRQRAVITPIGGGPAVTLNGVSQFLLEGFEIRAKGNPVAVEMRGKLSGTRLSRLVIADFAEAGVKADNAYGSVEDQGDLVFDAVVFRGSSGQMVGLTMNRARSVAVRKCRFYGPLATGIMLQGADASVDRIDVQESIFTDADAGLKIDATKMKLTRLSVWSNTFHKLREAIVFSDVPAVDRPESADFKFRLNLFSNVKQGEVIVERGASTTIAAMAGPSGIESNWSDRPVPESTNPQEIDVFVNQGHRGAQLNFVSTDPTHAKFLVPRPDAAHAAAGALSP
ncbi:MAG: protein kinase [Planctomycetaceae bacterium]